MAIHVEFYGIPRKRTGVSCTQCEPTSPSMTLADILRDLQQRFPNFGADCTNDGQLATSVIANLSGERFVRDATTTIHDGETVLFLSADAGG